MRGGSSRQRRYRHSGDGDGVASHFQFLSLSSRFDLAGGRGRRRRRKGWSGEGEVLGSGEGLDLIDHGLEVDFEQRWGGGKGEARRASPPVLIPALVVGLRCRRSCCRCRHSSGASSVRSPAEAILRAIRGRDTPEAQDLSRAIPVLLLPETGILSSHWRPSSLSLRFSMLLLSSRVCKNGSL